MVVVAVEERDRRVRVARVEEAIELAPARARGEQEEQLADVVVTVGEHVPLRVPLVEGAEDLLQHLRRGDRSSRPLLFHVPGEELELLERMGALQRLLLLTFGDDHQLRGADELLVHLFEGDVVRMVGIEEGLAGGGVADFQQVRVVEAEGEHAGERDCHHDAAGSGGEPQGRVGEAVVELGEQIRAALLVLLRRLDEGKDDRVQRDDADEDREDPEARQQGELLDDGDARDVQRQDGEPVGEQRHHRRGVQLGVRLDDRGIAIAEAVIFLVEPFHRLYRVRVRARRDQ